MALLISAHAKLVFDVKSMFDSSFSNMTQFNRSEIHCYVDEYRVWMRGSLRDIMSRSGRSCGNTRPRTLRRWSVWSTVTSSSGMPAFMSQLVRMLPRRIPGCCSIRHRMSAERDIGPIIDGNRWWAEIYCMKTIQMSLISVFQWMLNVFDAMNYLPPNELPVSCFGTVNMWNSPFMFSI